MRFRGSILRRATARLYLTETRALQATMEHVAATGVWTFTYASKPDKPLTLTNEHFPEPTLESLADTVKDVFQQDPMQGRGEYCSGCCGSCGVPCFEWWCGIWNPWDCGCVATGSACSETYYCASGP
jgi:hypothetical protein